MVYGDAVDGDGNGGWLADVDERNSGGRGEDAVGGAQVGDASGAIDANAKTKTKGVSRYVFRKVRVADGLS